jgi:excisionase family DNA binding protein
MQSTTEDKLLTVPEVAERLGIQRERAYEMVKSGDIPSMRLSPRRIRVSEWALLEWLRSKESS